MKVIASRLSLGRDDAGYRFAELCVVVLARDLGFAHRIQIGIHHDDSKNRILIVRSIKLVCSPRELLTIHKNLLAALRILGTRVGPSHLCRAGAAAVISCGVRGGRLAGAVWDVSERFLRIWDTSGRRVGCRPEDGAIHGLPVAVSWQQQYKSA